MADKNILLVGAPRCGKTTLARKLAKKFGYSIISLDDIICAFGEMPECGIKNDGNFSQTAERFAPFLKGYLKELSEGTNFYGGIKFVIEGTHVDLSMIMPMLYEEKYKNKYKVIGLLHGSVTAEELFDTIKTHDTEDDWTYWCEDATLKEKCAGFLQNNDCLRKEFDKWDIKTYKVSGNREAVLDAICEEIG